MTIIESLFLNAIFILFPLFSYFLFATNERQLTKRTSDTLFDLALYTSLYILLKADIMYVQIKVMFITIPLLIAYLKNKHFTAFIFSCCIALQYIFVMQFNYFFVILEFITYAVFIFFLKKRNESDITIITTFVIIKSTYGFVELGNIDFNYFEMIKSVIVIPFTFYFMTHTICYLMTASEKTMNLHLTIKELEREKQLRDSLFKITHEIKNPIAVCKGYLDMFDPENESHVKRYIPIIKQEIERTLTLMDDFMMLTKVNVEKRKMDASVLLQDTCEILYFMLKEKKIKFSCSMIDEEVYIDGDYDRLKQVFVNVVKNAIEAIPTNKMGVIKFNIKKTSKELSVSITDNGVGMNKETLSKIGEAFYTTKKSGTGLGVKFSKEIIDAHDGHIEYKSKVNVGTTVIISLPLKKSF